jgi:hypothetical protein
MGWSRAKTETLVFKMAAKLWKNIDHHYAEKIPSVSHLPQPALLSLVPLVYIFPKILKTKASLEYIFL